MFGSRESSQVSVVIKASYLSVRGFLHWGLRKNSPVINTSKVRSLWGLMLNLNVKSDVDKLTRSLTGLLEKQVPFATAQALNAVAKKVQQAEQQNIRKTLTKPTPFTLNSVGVSKASKSNPVAKVYIKDIAAKYLNPYEVGGLHQLPGKALLNPKAIKLNQYGQLPRAALAALKARPDIFIGPVKTSKGTVNGVWQRGTDVKRVTLLNSKGKRLRGLNKSATTDQPKGRLKLLIRFGDALPVKKKLGYGSLAKQIVDDNLAIEFNKAMAAAIATAK